MKRLLFGALDRTQDLTEVVQDDAKTGTFWSKDCIDCRGTGALLLRGDEPDYSQKCRACKGSGSK